jgi:hypothetical protein
MKFTFAPETTPLAGYTIKRAIDRGGFGEVYYALSDSGKEVALKLLQRNQQIELRGVRQCLNLKHPNLVTIFDIRTDADEDHWVVMEYVSGKSLEQVLDDHPQGLPLAEVEAWLSGMAAGIAFLHDRGIVHRDLKPANVFRENGVVKIGDVGLSKFITPSRRSAQTESVGTVYYMAPEVAHGKYGSELDVYSLGVILYEMLTGRVPFEGESTGEILMKHMTESPDLTKIAAPFRAVLARALEKDPQRRTPGVAYLAEEFRRAMQGKPLAEEIPPSHFVDVQRLERKVALDSQPPAGGQRVPVKVAANGGNGAAWANGANLGHAHTLPYPPLAAAPAAGQQQTGPRTRWQYFADEVRRNPWLAVSLVIVFLVIGPGIHTSGRLFHGPVGMVIPAAFVYLAYWFFKNHRPLMEHPWRPGAGPPAWCPAARPAPAAAPLSSPPVVLPQVAVQTPPPPPPVLPAVKATPPKKPAPLLTPKTLRDVALRTRLADLSSSLSLAVLWSVAATGLVGLAAGFQPVLGPIGQGLADPSRAGLFALTTILGAWAVILPAKIWEGSGPETFKRRLIATAMGAAVGACAWWIGEALYVSPAVESVFGGRRGDGGLFRQVANLRLVSASQGPTLAGYVAFFASLFVLRRWWWQADAFRPNKFRIRSWIWSGAVAFFVPALFAFPQGWGVAWALAISAAVQLSAPWIPAKDRLALVEVKDATA